MFDSLSTLQKLIRAKKLAAEAKYTAHDISGNPVSFTTNISKPLRKLIIPFSPVQDLYGQDSPYPPGSSPNIWDEEWEKGMIGWDGAKAYSNERIRSKNFIPVVPGTTYYVKTSANIQIMYYDSNKTFVSYENSSKINGIITIPSNCYYMMFYVYLTTYGTTYKNDISINYPSTDQDYHPYSNICSITGWTGANVTRCGVNLLNINRTEGTPSPNTVFESPRVLDCSKYFVGLRHDNYYYKGYVPSYSVENGVVTVTSNNNVHYGVAFPVRCKPSTTYTLSATLSNSYLSIGCYDEHWMHISGISGVTATVPKIFTTPETAKYVTIIISSSTLGESGTASNIMLNEGSTAESYSAYSGTVLPISFPAGAGTVYGGKIDLTTGLLTVDGVLFTDWNILYRGDANTAGTGRIFYADFNNFNYTNVKDGVNIAKTNFFKPMTSASWSALNPGEINLTNTRYTVICIADPDATKQDFVDYVTENGVQYYVGLKIPVTYQLTAQQLSTLLGQNNIWTDTNGTNEITYLSK